jgi:tetratricopeptide (TPR) repeat protein
VDQANQAGIELSKGELETLRQALNLAQARQFDAAIPLLESLEEVAPVPAVLNNLGAAYLATGDRLAARRYFQATVARNPNEQAAQINLGALDELAQQEESVSSPTARNVTSNISNVSVELVEFSRFENTITLKLRYINTGEMNQSGYLAYGSYLLDEGTGSRYNQIANTNSGSSSTIPAGGSLDFWVKYTLPEGGRPQFLTAVLSSGVLLEHLEVP